MTVFGTKKKSLNRNASRQRSFYDIDLKIWDLRNQQSPFLANFHEFSKKMENQLLGVLSSRLSSIEFDRLNTKK